MTLIAIFSVQKALELIGNYHVKEQEWIFLAQLCLFSFAWQVSHYLHSELVQPKHKFLTLITD